MSRTFLLAPGVIRGGDSASSQEIPPHLGGEDTVSVTSKILLFSIVTSRTAHGGKPLFMFCSWYGPPNPHLQLLHQPPPLTATPPG